MRVLRFVLSIHTLLWPSSSETVTRIVSFVPFIWDLLSSWVSSKSLEKLTDCLVIFYFIFRKKSRACDFSTFSIKFFSANPLLIHFLSLLNLVSYFKESYIDTQSDLSYFSESMSNMPLIYNPPVNDLLNDYLLLPHIWIRFSISVLNYSMVFLFKISFIITLTFYFTTFGSTFFGMTGIYGWLRYEKLPYFRYE